jgi:hypothetical protein
MSPGEDTGVAADGIAGPSTKGGDGVRPRPGGVLYHPALRVITGSASRSAPWNRAKTRGVPIDVGSHGLKKTWLGPCVTA